MTPPWAVDARRAGRCRAFMLRCSHTDAACLRRSSELPAVKSNTRWSDSTAAKSSAKGLIFSSDLTEEMGKTGKRVDYAQGACHRCAMCCSNTATRALQRHAPCLCRLAQLARKLQGVGGMR